MVNKMTKAYPPYLLSAALLFIVEVLIALYAHDDIIRPYVGDVLVVMLLYCFIKSFLNSDVHKTALLVLLFSYAVETAQYVDFVQHLGLAHSKLANVVMGNYFSWIDILVYTLGFIIVLLIEKLRRRKKPCDGRSPEERFHHSI